MVLIGIAEAARRSGVTVDGMRRGLKDAGVTLVAISPRAFAVEETDLAAFLASRPAGYKGRGRPARPKLEPVAPEAAE